MPDNIILSPQTAASIDRQVDKVLRDLGMPEPPLSLDLVRDRLELDLGYYTSGDDSWLREKLHRMKLAGKQVWNRPGLMLDAVKKFSLKALYLPDRKRILIDGDLPPVKQRWAEGHEIAHSLLPWHDGVALGDENTTLSPECHAQVEAEANYGSGRSRAFARSTATR